MPLGTGDVDKGRPHLKLPLGAIVLKVAAAETCNNAVGVGGHVESESLQNSRVHSKMAEGPSIFLSSIKNRRKGRHRYRWRTCIWI